MHIEPRKLLGAIGLAAALLAVSPTALAAGDDVLYQIQPGDTLSELGYRLLETPLDWRKLQRLNRVADPVNMPVGSVLRIPVAMLRPLAAEASLQAVQGAVTLDGGPAAPGSRVGPGRRLETGAGSFVTVALPDGSRITLQPESSLRVLGLGGYRGLEGQDARFELERGRVETSVVPQRGPAARYRIHTPTAVIGVRGTDFRVSTDAVESIDRTEVTGGLVSVGAGGREVRVPGGFGVVAAKGRAPAAPVELLPAPDLSALPSRFERPVLRFEFPQLAAAGAYRLQIARDRGFLEPLAESRFSGTTARVAGLQDGDYWMRLRGIDDSGLEGRNADFQFTLKARPEPPILLGPANNAKIRAGAVDLRWADSPDAGAYVLELASDESFSTVLRRETRLESSGKRLDLAPGDYFLRIASIRGESDQGPWGDALKFRMRPAPADPDPPKQGDGTLELSWPAEPGQRFEYQLARDEAFSDVVVAAAVAEPHATIALPPPDAYYLRVRAIDADGYIGPYTSPQRFVIATPFPWWLGLVPCSRCDRQVATDQPVAARVALRVADVQPVGWCGNGIRMAVAHRPGHLRRRHVDEFAQRRRRCGGGRDRRHQHRPHRPLAVAAGGTCRAARAAA